MPGNEPTVLAAAVDKGAVLKSPDPGATLEPEEIDDDESANVTSQVDERISTASLRSSIKEYRLIHGRGYHKRMENYFLPSDEGETDRLDLQNHHLLLTLKGKTHLCAGAEKARRVLDAGTGTGIWAVAFADEHPEAEVIGVDVAAIQPSYVPPNCRFEIDNLEEEWTWTSEFDYIFVRMMVGSLSDWDKFIRQAWDHLEPGGWIEQIDPVLPALSHDGTLKPDSALSKYDECCFKAGRAFGCPFDASQKHEERLKKQGFVNVQRINIKWPTNTWPKDPHWKEVGLWTLANIERNLEGVSMALMTRGLGMSDEEALRFLEEVRKDFRNTKIHAYWPLIVVIGQKPTDAKE